MNFSTLDYKNINLKIQIESSEENSEEKSLATIEITSKMSEKLLGNTSKYRRDPTHGRNCDLNRKSYENPKTPANSQASSPTSQCLNSELNPELNHPDRPENFPRSFKFFNVEHLHKKIQNIHIP